MKLLLVEHAFACVPKTKESTGVTEDNHVVSQNHHARYGVFADEAFIDHFKTDSVEHEKVTIFIANDEEVFSHA